MTWDTIPPELRERPQWVVWQYELRDGEPTKVPRSPRGRAASSTDPGTWGTFEDVLLAAGTDFDGIGFVFSPDDPYCGIDLDDCLAEGELHPRAARLVQALDSFTEISPSGSGVKLIVRASKNGTSRCRRRATWGGDLEIYDRDRFWTITGNPWPGAPATIEERQPQLDAILRAAFPPEEEGGANAPRPVVPVDVDDQELLDRARAAANGPKFSALYDQGDTAGYASRSEADLALCSMLAFWVGRDATRIDRMFRASGLYRDKWERADYRERTIDAAVAGTTETYSPQVRPGRDALGTHPASAHGDGSEGAGASRVPPIRGRRDSDAPSPTPDEATTVASSPVLEVEVAEEFAAVDEPSAEPLLGDDDNTVLAAGGAAVHYGDGGAGKTTLLLDQAFHLCTGRDWLGLTVPRPVRVLWIENEGPRGKFRQKVEAKLAAWDGPPLAGRLLVLAQPWGRFTFGDDELRAELVELVKRLEVEVLIAGPVSRLGAKGGGTPEEIQAFVDLLEQVRAELDRPLAYELVHHENKAGDVSGAWEGATDTLAHVQARGNGHTAVVWRKTRWAPDLHGKTWKLNWRDGERFEVDETPETTDEDIAEKLLGLVRAAPGGSWNSYEKLIENAQATRKRRIRDELLEDGRLVNGGTAKAMRLFLPEQAPEQTTMEDE